VTFVTASSAKPATGNTTSAASSILFKPFMLPPYLVIAHSVDKELTGGNYLAKKKPPAVGRISGFQGLGKKIGFESNGDHTG
jgi:hypothetical protein